MVVQHYCVISFMQLNFQTFKNLGAILEEAGATFNNGNLSHLKKFEINF